MKPVSHQYEDKLLEFAYGELPAHEASAIDAHVKTCARCTAALGEIRSVRSAMSALPQVPVPDKGLDSLLAYAEQAAKRNAETAAPVPFFARFRKWIAPLAGATAVLLVGGVYYKASQNLDLSKEHAATEVAQKKAMAEYRPVAPSAAPAETEKAEAAAEPKPLELAKNAEPEKLKEAKPVEGGAFDGLTNADAKVARAPTKGSPAKPSPKTKAVQRDDQERIVDNEMQAAGAKPADAPAPELERGGKGGGGRRELDSAPSNYYDARTAAQGSSTGTSTGGINDLVAKADTIDRKQSVSKRTAANKDLGTSNGDDSEGFRAKTAPVAKKGKKAKLEVSDSPGGGEITRPATGSFSNEIAADKSGAKVDEKKAEEKKPVTVAAKEAPPPAANVWTPEEAAKAQQGQNGSAQQNSPYGVSSSAPQQAAPQQQAAQPPPPPRQRVTTNAAPSKSSLGLGIQSRQRSSADEESLAQGDVAGPPSVTAAELANNRKGRQTQLMELMQRARAADNAGDLKQEYQLCDELLRGDAEGDLRAEGLYRMCSLLQRLGEEDRAQPYCSQLQTQFSSTRWAAMARSIEQNRRAAPPKASSKKNAYQQDQNYESPSPAPAEQKSAPTESSHAY